MLAGLAASALKSPWTALAEDFVTLPFENGKRPLVKYPQKRPLIRLTTRPPQLEKEMSSSRISGRVSGRFVTG